MTIEKKKEGNQFTILLEGRLDTSTSPELEKELRVSLNSEVSDLIFDFKNLDYISSAGLRVLLAAQKTMTKQGNMIIRHVNDVIMEIFEVTGFADILTIE